MLIGKKKNKYPYILLLIIHSCLLLYTFKKHAKTKGILALLLSNMGFAFFFDYFVVSFFPGYTYRPKMIKNKYLDNVLGATLSQAVFVPFTAIFITAFRHGWLVKLLFACYFAVIEKIFTLIGIFKKGWWKTRYTFLLIPFYFYISDFRWKGLENENSIMKSICLFNMIHLTWINGIYVLEVLKVIRFGFKNNYKWKNQLKIVPFYAMSYSLLATIVTIRGRASFKTVLLSVLIGIDQCLLKAKIMKIKSIYPLIMIHIITIYLSHLYYYTLLDKRNFVDEKSL
ncbi:hypothetical protein [Evansella cellulosilytica]|uniref:Uncharacterized protein n=1 Tax=Evansella cellulosilytica (strain ATCC 21833 / DSM 2522 / FERM P-1141 / JCM 9156 / N-4) TaxID=649639 RepID=E6U016_EVAC2|nr:hypothetical protein [Evansella cellulosilytica]ADU29020.1 hypothetical protein Bcell_0739 [Evansella cellulosilytica DSM 2522]